MGREALVAFGGFIIGALFIYWFYGRIRTTREFALLHLIERITAKELTSHSLETELKEIIQERDNIIKDRFDSIIEHCLVLDTETAVSVDELFSMISSALADRLKMNKSAIRDLLIAREKETSTVIGHGVAIPHIIIEGSNQFDILLVRSQDGIQFSENGQKIHTVFVLIGTRDERNFHLRALAAIAQVCQSPSFLKKWLKARNKESLRDIVLVSKRMR